MFTPRQHENNLLFILRWTARILSAVSIAMLLLFMFGEGLDLSNVTWEEMGAILLFPLGLIAGLIMGWQEETKGGALAVCSVAAFYFVYGLVLNGSLRQGWWIMIFAIPGFLYLFYGALSSVSRTKAATSGKARGHA